MNRLLPLIVALLFFTNSAFGRQTIDLTAQTLKIEPQQETKLYYGFAAGDKISFTFEVADKNYISEVEVLEYPTNSKYSDMNVTKLNLKTIVVSKEGVYVFRLKNLAPTSRVCKFKIQRTPASNLTAGFIQPLAGNSSK